MTARIIAFPGCDLPKRECEKPLTPEEYPWHEALDRFAIEPLNILHLFADMSEPDRLRIKLTLDFLENVYAHLKEQDEVGNLFSGVLDGLPWDGAA